MSIIQDDEATIALAVKSLEKSIDRIVERRAVDKRTQRQIQTLVDHTHHLLRQLFEKRQSLRALLEWFRQEWNRLESELPNNHSVAILQHSIQMFVRCQDGLVMLTSGECRHPGDILQARKTKFPSRLSTLKERQDGYTCLYKADAVYSGFGWDEFANETVGIQARMVSLLKTFLKSPWDYLDRQGATQLLELLLDQQESALKDLQQELQALKRRMIQDITQRLRPTKLSFVTQDKMERLTLTFQQQTIRLERRADSFQIQGSVLPNPYKSAKDWQSYSLQLLVTNNPKNTSSTSKRKRLVIEDSESEEEGIQNGNKIKPKAAGAASQKQTTIEKTSGLMVRVETSKPTAETEDSLTAIKTQMGVDVQGLETSREELQQETSEDYHYEEEKVVRLKKIFKRAQERQHVDENEVWDARECLRQSYMELGNDCLWLSKTLETALDSFRQAQSLVKEQQASHQHSIENTNDDTGESRYIKRNLLFLLGQATVNSGIVLVEWSQKERMARKKTNEAIQEFRHVRKLAEDMRQHAKSDQQKCRARSMEWMEAMTDILKADQLESLACRWMGLALWSSSQEKQAIEVLDHASSFFHGTNNAVGSRILENILEVAAECIYATCTLTDLTCSAMERLGRSSRQRGDELLCVVVRSLERHAEISQEIENLASEASFAGAVQVFQQENEISSSKDILENLNEIKRWWENIKRQPTGLGLKNSIPRLSSILPRSDLFPEGAPRQYAEPTAHILVSEGSRHRKQKRSQTSANTLRSSNSQDALRALQDEATSKTTRRPIMFRKWGDELLSQEVVDPETPGEIRPRLTYPCIAPTMPPDIQTVFESQ